MRRVRLIRHGQSAANAGQASRDHASIPLTPLGLEQARMIAGSFSVAPDLIVASPFARAQATAQATAATFPGTAIETWAVEEFTYLAPDRCVDTTVSGAKGVLIREDGTPIQYTTDATMAKVSGRVFGGAPDACSELNKRDWNRVFE